MLHPDNGNCNVCQNNDKFSTFIVALKLYNGLWPWKPKKHEIYTNISLGKPQGKMPLGRLSKESMEGYQADRWRRKLHWTGLVTVQMA